MTQKQLQGDWEKQPNSGTSLNRSVSHSRNQKVPRHAPDLDPKLSKQPERAGQRHKSPDEALISN